MNKNKTTTLVSKETNKRLNILSAQVGLPKTELLDIFSRFTLEQVVHFVNEDYSSRGTEVHESHLQVEV